MQRLKERQGDKDWWCENGRCYWGSTKSTSRKLFRAMLRSKHFKAFLVDVSLFFVHMGMSMITSNFWFLLILFPVLYCFQFILSQLMMTNHFFNLILHPNFYLYIKLDFWWLVFKCQPWYKDLPSINLLPSGYMWQYCGHLLFHVLQEFKVCSVIPFTHQEHCLQYYQKTYSSSSPSILYSQDDSLCIVILCSRSTRFDS